MTPGVIPFPSNAIPGCWGQSRSGMLGVDAITDPAEGNSVTDSVVIHQVDGAVATITINRPEARNALTAETKVALLSALRDCSLTTRSARWS